MSLSRHVRVVQSSAWGAEKALFAVVPSWVEKVYWPRLTTCFSGPRNAYQYQDVSRRGFLTKLTTAHGIAPDRGKWSISWFFSKVQTQLSVLNTEIASVAERIPGTNQNKFTWSPPLPMPVSRGLDTNHTVCLRGQAQDIWHFSS